MRILLTGIACVGKSTMGELLAKELNYRFFDFDIEIEKHFNESIERIKNRFWTEHGFRDLCAPLLKKILKDNPDNIVIAMPPSGLFDCYWRIIKNTDNLITIVLKDSSKNILKRLTFYDIDSKPIEIKMTPKKLDYYYSEIKKDVLYFGRVYNRADLSIKINGRGIEGSLALLKQEIEKYSIEHGITSG